MLEPNEVVPGFEEATQDGKAGLGVRLTPLPRRWVVVLQRREAGAGHLEPGDVEDDLGVGVEVGTSVAQAKGLQRDRVADQRHGHTLGAALLVAGRNAAEDGAPGLAGLVPGRDGLAGDGADGRVSHVEVILAGRRLLQQLTGAMSQQLVDTDLDLEGDIAVVREQIPVLVADEGDRFVRRLGRQDVAQRYVLKALGLAKVGQIAKDAGKRQ